MVGRREDGLIREVRGYSCLLFSEPAAESAQWGPGTGGLGELIPEWWPGGGGDVLDAGRGLGLPVEGMWGCKKNQQWP